MSHTTRRAVSMFAVAALGAAMLAAPAPAHAAPVTPDELAAGIARQRAAGIQVVPKGAAQKEGAYVPDPALALLRDPAAVDQFSLRKRRAELAQKRSAELSKQRATARSLAKAAPTPIAHTEREAATVVGGNDTLGRAELIKRFGTRESRNNRSVITGVLAPDPNMVTLPRVPEDNGAIPLAPDTGVAATRTSVRVDGTVGDGPHGRAGDATGDFDFYKVSGVPVGTALTIDIDTPTGDLDSVVAVFDATGAGVAFNDDGAAGNPDSFLRLPLPTAGDYYVLVSGFGIGTPLPRDPNDSGSGTGAGSEGDYVLTLSAAAGVGDVDYYAFDLRAGDVLGGSVTGAATLLSVRDADGVEEMGSGGDATALYSRNSPLPGGGNAVVDFVAPRTGRYTIAVSGGTGPYVLTAEAYRPGPEADDSGTTQRIFLDFDGARVNTNIFGGRGVRDLSPFTSFLTRWGLTAADADAVIDRTVEVVEENLAEDMAAKGTNPRTAVQIRNSRDHRDTFGQPNVSRVIVGGTVAEAGIDTIGIAESIDPGNYGNEETALVLLDGLSSPAGPEYSVNTWLKPGSDKVKFVGTVLGNVISHEAGHYLGNWHVDQFNTVPSLMDQGGNPRVMFGVGPDGIGGSADDPDVDMIADTVNPAEGRTGLEDVLNRTAWALTKGKA